MRFWRAVERKRSTGVPASRGTASRADTRLERCPFGEQKPTCANCLVHCYKADMRERMREVMRFAGPRMLRRHPILALWHVLDGFREPQELPSRKKR